MTRPGAPGRPQGNDHRSFCGHSTKVVGLLKRSVESTDVVYDEAALLSVSEGPKARVSSRSLRPCSVILTAPQGRPRLLPLWRLV
jgi:hypothetical protein